MNVNPPFVILALAVLYAHYASNPQVAAALRGMGAVSGGLIAATGVKLIPPLRRPLLEAAASAWHRCASAWPPLTMARAAWN